VVADSLDLLYGLTLDSGARWGAVATVEQRTLAAAVLVPGDGPRLYWYEAPKGYSKSTDTAGLSIARLATDFPPLAEGYVIAADLDQSNRLLDKAQGTDRPVRAGWGVAGREPSARQREDRGTDRRPGRGRPKR
jgi:hypothetical protein